MDHARRAFSRTCESNIDLSGATRFAGHAVDALCYTARNDGTLQSAYVPSADGLGDERPGFSAAAG